MISGHSQLREKRSKDRGPDFVGVGAPKCGSTLIARYLTDHPDIEMSAPKETHYFTENFCRGPSWYSSHFKNAASNKVVGEFSTDYLAGEEVAERIYGELGEVKIIISVRNPVSRLQSDLNHSIRDGYLNKRRLQTIDFSADLADDSHVKDRVSRGLYSAAIARYVSLFGGENVFILNADKLFLGDLSQMEQVFKFLAVTPTPTEKLDLRNLNKGYIPRSRLIEAMKKWLYRMLSNSNVAMRVVRGLSLGNLYRFINGAGQVALTERQLVQVNAIYREDWHRTLQILSNYETSV